jgi:Domain of unknown function (DUF4440)
LEASEERDTIPLPARTAGLQRSATMFLNFLICAAALTASSWQQTTKAADDVIKREQQRVEYLMSGKLDELAGLLSPTLTYTHSSSVLDTKAKFLEKLRTGELVYKSLKHSDVQVRFPTPDVAILNGLSDVSAVSAGQAMQVSLRFTIVYVKKNGVWLMEAWHSARTAQ